MSLCWKCQQLKDIWKRSTWPKIDSVHCSGGPSLHEALGEPHLHYSRAHADFWSTVKKYRFSSVLYDWWYSSIYANLYRSHRCCVFSSPSSPPWVSQWMVPTTVVRTQARNLKLTRWILVWSCDLAQSHLGSSSPDCYLQGLHLSRRAADLTYEGNMNDFTATFLWVLFDQASSRIDKW